MLQDYYAEDNLIKQVALPMQLSSVMMMMTMVIARGSKGIGKQIALSLINRGCHVSIIARKESDLKAACEELQTVADQRGQKQKVRWYSLDLTKGYHEVESVIRQAEKELGPVDALINNAGTSVQVLSVRFCKECKVVGMTKHFWGYAAIIGCV
ncbi:unnamed protein product [Heligmosomoides polygyrus]|uniref:Carbonyl reductase [NADPH] 1-like n=1 Tax=Heligmosomoides polygyrus TaxID=6339 RepID=A0A183GNS5_HELPZ|nr:unnamed protein product [Heligmosomoides polygyrus]